MPRTGKGGKREGAPGTAYSNRSDLNQPAQADPEGRPYGEAKAQVAAQRDIPLPQQAPPGAGGGQPPVNAPIPGELGQLFGPSQRPDEPLTAGADFGPGPGSESLLSRQLRQTWRTKLQDIARSSGDEYLTTLLEGY